jgi:hypothetical protein
MEIGIVGLPNVGKSTLFNAMLKSELAEAANFAFTTIEPNVGIVEVPDERLDKLAEIEHSARVVPATIKFVDIAGLIAGAHKGEGLGNKFLAHIREVDAIAMVIRTFSDENVLHVGGKVDPKSDIDTVMTELALSDLETVQKKLLAVEKEARSGDKRAKLALPIYEKVKNVLLDAKPISSIGLSDDEKSLIQDANFLTVKSFIYVFNVAEDEINKSPAQIISQYELAGSVSDSQVVIISAKIEGELSGLADEERSEFLQSYGIDEPGLNGLVRVGYKTLNLQSFFTAGVQEARAWTVDIGATAPEAAGKIHTDFEKKFIKAEVVAYDDFVFCGGWLGSKEKGKARL